MTRVFPELEDTVRFPESPVISPVTVILPFKSIPPVCNVPDTISSKVTSEVVRTFWSMSNNSFAPCPVSTVANVTPEVVVKCCPVLYAN